MIWLNFRFDSDERPMAVDLVNTSNKKGVKIQGGPLLVLPSANWTTTVMD